MRDVLLVATMTLLAGGARADGSSERLVQRWHQRACGTSLVHDGPLASVARSNSLALLELPPDGGEHREPDSLRPGGLSSFLRFLLERQPVRDALVRAHAVRFRRPEMLHRQLLAFLRRRAAGCDHTHFGLGLARSADGTSSVLTVLLLRRRVEIRSVQATPGAPLRLCARVLQGSRPRLLVTLPDGHVRERAVHFAAAGQRAFCVELGRAGRGRHEVEVMLNGPFGPEVAALFPLFVGVSPPTVPVEKLYPVERLRRGQAEQRLLQLINRSRARSRLPPLQLSRQLGEVARAHSADMLVSGFFGHHSPQHGDLTRRLARAGLSGVQASENLALSTSPARAHEALMASPSHRQSLLEPFLTHVGIGVVIDPNERLFFVTECFARLLPEMSHYVPDPETCCGIP